MNGARRPKPPSGTRNQPSDRQGCASPAISPGSSAGTGKAVPLLLRPAAVSSRIMAMSPLARASTLLSSYGRSFAAIGLAAFRSAMPFGFLVAIEPATSRRVRVRYGLPFTAFASPAPAACGKSYPCARTSLRFLRSTRLVDRHIWTEVFFSYRCTSWWQSRHTRTKSIRYSAPIRL